MNEPRFEDRSIDTLVPHELQADTFSPPSPSERRILRTSIEQDGIKEPPDITPDGRIISGHTRIDIARELGWDEIKVRVRYDLTDEQEIVRELVDANLGRRNLGSIAKTRAIVCREAPERRLAESATSNAAVVKAVADGLNVDPRHARRWIQIAIGCPLNVQQAVDDKCVTQGDAARLCKLPEAVKQGVSERITAGESAKDVVREHVTPVKNETSPIKRLIKLADDLESIVNIDVPCNDESVTSGECQRVLDVFGKFAAFATTVDRRLSRMLRQKKKQDTERSAVLQSDLEELFSLPQGTNCPS
jgi:ParB-like chromosome segregation protein Spo0J